MSDDSPAAGHATESEKHATAPGRTEPEKMVAALSRTSEEPARDRTGFKLAAYVATLIVVLFAGYGLGRVNNGAASAAAPQQNPGAAPQALGATAMPGMVMDGTQPHTHAGGGTSGQRATVGGFSLSSAGLTLVSQGTTFAAGQPQRLAFRITAVGGAPVTAFAVVHGMPLHLVVIRRDLSAFQHLHPIMAPDGTWSIDLTLPAPGIYRMIADFTAVVGGRQVTTTLGTDLTVAGNYLPAALPAPARASVDDDLTVRYEGTPDLRSIQTILLSVTGADGRPAALEPYLGASGHLVVLRQGDLAYLHLHPETMLVDGKVHFRLSVPSAGAYRMFFNFQVAGRVRTATWTLRLDP